MGQMSDDDREQLVLHGKIAAALMLVLQNSMSSLNLRDKTLLFLTYASAVVKNEYGFARMFLDVLNCRVLDTGLDWYTLEDATSLDILCYKMAEGIRFEKGSSDKFSFVGMGEAICRKGVLRICSSDAGELGSRAFAILDDRLEVVTRNVREERLKGSEQNDAEALARFAATFLRTQDEYAVAGPKEREYKVGDVVAVRFSTVDNFECVIVDQSMSVMGRVVDEELVKGTWTRNVIPYLFDGDCIKDAKIIGTDGDDFLISIRDAYLAYALKCAREDHKNNVIMEAVVSEVKPDMYAEGRVTWMTPSGYGGISFPLNGRKLKPGDKVPMIVLNIQSSSTTTFINLGEPRYDYDRIDKHFGGDNEEVLAAFVTTPEQVLAEKDLERKTGKNEKDAEIILRLASVLANRSVNEASLESYRQRIVAVFLAKLADDQESVDALLPEEYYLRNCLSFAQGNGVPAEHEYSLPEQQRAVLKMLSMWDGSLDDLMKQTSSLPVDSLPWKIGSLLLGKQLSSQNKDEISADADTIREKICSLLGVEPLFRSGTVTRRGKYGNTESQEVEFKSSYVYRNDNGEPDIDYQGRGQVFEAVCGFLNADGGTVYVGVNNDGDPLVSKDAGVNADMQWLRTNFKFLNGMRSRQLGHAICEVKDLDSFVQFLNSEKELYFKESLQGNIIIEVTEDADAIKITVSPAEYEIAYLYKDKTHVEGEAFVRDGGRTIRMSRVRKEQRLTELKRIRKEMGFVVDIQEAIDRQGKLVFKGYSSGNSGEVEDRQVVPINLFYNDENVYCLDLVSRKEKQFRLHRISSIEVLPGTYTLQKYTPRRPDVFRWLNEGGKQYHIKLKMKARARNYLLEEYSCAEKLPETEFYEEKKNVWILDTYVNGLVAVRRFYLGLADQIEILDTEDSETLKADIAAYVKESVIER
ncbi:MAG: WYL domain-containing protein [Bacteroidales bacterium]|nr:WYL domain-containing protein [Bacteroidales bacterium]